MSSETSKLPYLLFRFYADETFIEAMAEAIKQLGSSDRDVEAGVETETPATGRGGLFSRLNEL